jgi:hypothetical protein
VEGGLPEQGGSREAGSHYQDSASGRPQYQTTLPSMPISFGEYAERWLSTAKGSLAVKTHANYRQLLTLYILRALRAQSITTLTWETIKTLLMAKQQEGLSVNSIRLIRAVISTILTDAAEEGII